MVDTCIPNSFLGLIADPMIRAKVGSTVELRIKSAPPKHNFEFITLFLYKVGKKKSGKFKIMSGRT